MNRFACLIVVGVLLALRGLAVADDKAGQRLTIELRDGSRVVGQTLEDNLSLHSATLGDMKLPWASISAIDFAADAKSARLKAANGDAFTVQIPSDNLSVQTEFGKTDIPLRLIADIKVSALAKANTPAMISAPDGAKLRVKLALRDGSRLVGKPSDDNLTFHSTAMGDLKLTWPGVRSIAFKAAGTDPAKLTAANGDLYQVQFVASTVRLETDFGKLEVPVKLIRDVTVSTEGEAGEHLIGWWKLDDGTGNTAADSSPSDPPHGGTLTNGPTWDQAGEALQFNGSNQNATLGNILQGSYDAISIACWIKRGNSGPQTLVERGDWNNSDGIDLCVEGSAAQFGHGGAKVVSNASVQDGKWHHLVGTMSRDENGSGYVYNLYVDGKLDNTATSPMGLAAATPYPGGWGWVIGGVNGNWSYQGLMKDVRIYDCALTAGDIESIYAERANDDDSPEASAPPVTPTATDVLK